MNDFFVRLSLAHNSCPDMEIELGMAGSAKAIFLPILNESQQEAMTADINWHRQRSGLSAHKLLLPWEREAFKQQQEYKLKEEWLLAQHEKLRKDDTYAP